MGRTMLGHFGWQLKQCPHKEYESFIAGLMTEGRLKGLASSSGSPTPSPSGLPEATMLSRSLTSERRVVLVDP